MADVGPQDLSPEAGVSSAPVVPAAAPVATSADPHPTASAAPGEAAPHLGVMGLEVHAPPQIGFDDIVTSSKRPRVEGNEGGDSPSSLSSSSSSSAAAAAAADSSADSFASAPALPSSSSRLSDGAAQGSVDDFEDDIDGAEDSSARTPGAKSDEAPDAGEVLKRRNREHARQTRLRKKAYVVGLEQRLKEMQSQLSNEGASKEQEEKMMSTMHTQSTLLLTALFRGELHLDMLSHLVSPHVQYLSPITPFRSFAAGDTVDGMNYSVGAHALVAHSQSWGLFFKHTIGYSTNGWCLSKIQGGVPLVDVQAEYVSGTPVAKSAGYYLLYGRFSVCTRNMREMGAANDVSLSGMMMITVRVTDSQQMGTTMGGGGFSMGRPSTLPFVEKIDLSFDVMSVLQQLRHALSGNIDRARAHFVVPNQINMLPPNEVLPRIIIDVQDPSFPIVDANPLWVDLFHGRHDEEKGQPDNAASDGSSSSSSVSHQSAIIGLYLRYLLSDFKIVNQDFHAGMSGRIIEALQRRYCCAGVVSLVVPSKARSASLSAGEGEREWRSHPVHITLYPLWGDDTRMPASRYMALVFPLEKFLTQSAPHLSQAANAFMPPPQQLPLQNPNLFTGLPMLQQPLPMPQPFGVDGGGAANPFVNSFTPSGVQLCQPVSFTSNGLNASMIQGATQPPSSVPQHETDLLELANPSWPLGP